MPPQSTPGIAHPGAALAREGGKLSPSAPRRVAPPWPWLTCALLILALAVGFVLATGDRPAFDAYGWLVWGQQTLHGGLSTIAAPSWKPLTFLFTLPYAALFGSGALWAWMITATAAGFAAAVFGGRIAFRLARGATERRLVPWASAIGAGAGVLGIEGYWHFLLIFTADPMMVALLLATVDQALGRRFGWAWLLMVLLSLGRPEGAVLALPAAVWTWRQVPQMRRALVVGVLAWAVLWFGVPILTAGSWSNAADVLGESTHPLPGDKLSAVLRGLASLYELPMQIAAVTAIAVAAALRQRLILLLAAGAAAWVAVDWGLALHGWGIAPRYLFEPAALLVVLVAAVAGRLLTIGWPQMRWVRWPAVAAVLVLLGTMAPHVRIRARLVHNGIVLGRVWAQQIDRLHRVIAREGGPANLLRCGQPVTTVPYQTILAWELGRNVIEIGWKPNVWDKLRTPQVRFDPVFAGWQISTINTRFGGNAAAGHLPGRPHTKRQRRAHNTVHDSLAAFFGSEPTPVRVGSPTVSRCVPLSARTETN